MVEVECGGGHRSWALQTSKTDEELVFFFLKDGRPYRFQTSLKDKLMPLIKVFIVFLNIGAYLDDTILSLNTVLLCYFQL